MNEADTTRITFSGKHTIFNCVDIVLSNENIENMKKFVESPGHDCLVIEPGTSEAYDAIRMLRIYKSKS